MHSEKIDIKAFSMGYSSDHDVWISKCIYVMFKYLLHIIDCDVYTVTFVIIFQKYNKCLSRAFNVLGTRGGTSVITVWFCLLQFEKREKWKGRWWGGNLVPTLNHQWKNIVRLKIWFLYMLAKLFVKTYSVFFLFYLHIDSIAG